MHIDWFGKFYFKAAIDQEEIEKVLHSIAKFKLEKSDN